MGKGLGLVLLAALAAAAAGCGGGGSSTSGSTTHATTTPLPKSALGANVTVSQHIATTPYTDEEKAYLRRLHGWLRSVGSAEARLDFAAHDGPTHRDLLKGKLDARLRPELRVLSMCARRLAAVGTPPTSRLREGLRLLKVACRKMSAAAAQVEKVASKSDPSALVFFDDDLTQADTAVDTADQALVPQETRELPSEQKPSDASHTDDRFSNAIALEFDMTADVRCWSKHDWPKILDESDAFTLSPDKPGTEVLGFVLTGDRINLAPEICDELYDLIYRHEHPVSGEAAQRAAEGLVTLTHEAEHVAGTGVEAAAECYAMQDAADVGINLGLTQRYARQLSTLYWREIYPDNLPSYKSSECHTDGRLDLYSDNLWP